MTQERTKIILLLGPTASGKTSFGVRLAGRLDAEIVGADSRQIYVGLDLGSGKDLAEYVLPDGRAVPHHLIDVRRPNEEYSLADYVKDATAAVERIRSAGRVPLFVGGTALYLHALVFGYRLPPGPPNAAEREALRALSTEDLRRGLAELSPNDSILQKEPDNRTRLIRRIEMERKKLDPPPGEDIRFPDADFLVLGVLRPRREIHARIEARLDERLAAGMLDEARRLHKEGVSWERLEFFGLEYRYMARHLQGFLSFDEMREQLLAKIRQFAKRQDSWFRRFEKDGRPIYWLAPDELERAVRLSEDFLADRPLPPVSYRLSEHRNPVKPDRVK